MIAGGAPPEGGAASLAPPQGQATGPGGASMPTPNRGLEAASLVRLAVLVQALQTAVLPTLSAGSDAARDVREAINKLAKHVPPGAVSEGVKMSESQRQLMQQQQMRPQIAAMRAGQMGGGQPQGQAQPQPQPPMAA
jgi:hypothetical protein